MSSPVCSNFLLMLAQRHVSRSLFALAWGEICENKILNLSHKQQSSIKKCRIFPVILDFIHPIATYYFIVANEVCYSHSDPCIHLNNVGILG